jgi:SAM-dependent methyltransferase
MRALEISSQSIEHLLGSGVVEFLDLGCGSGGSCEFIRRYTDMRVGLSLDLSDDKVQQCRKVNDLTFAYDVTTLPRVAESVSSAFCMHFLEHVDTAANVFRIIELALNASRDFMIVRQPYFDHDVALAALGCHTYWSDWSGHKTKLSSSMIANLSETLFAKGLLQEVSTFGIDRIESTSHPSILPLGAESNQHHYDPERHGVKPLADITFDCFREIFIVFQRGTITADGMNRLAQVMAVVQPRLTPLSQTRYGAGRAAAA